MILSLIISYGWILALVLVAVLYKFVLRAFGVVIVPENKVGHVVKKFKLIGANKDLPQGKLIALNGESGFQADTLVPGVHLWMWPWQYDISMVELVSVPKGKIALISAKDGVPLPNGKILAKSVACDAFQNAKAFLTSGGQKGPQVDVLSPGTYRINRFLFDVALADAVNINDNQVGIVTALEGLPLEVGAIAGKHLDIKVHNSYQDFNKFLEMGGQKGLQSDVILAGTYYLNPWAVTVEQKPMAEIPIGYVGVVISYIGEEGQDVTGQEFKHGNIVKKGEKGVWIEPYGPGKYPINPYTMKIELVPTTNLVLNWANARTESHNLDQNLNTITVRSKDGFKFNLDVSQIIHVPLSEAPKVIARFGNMKNLVSQVLEPTIGNYFRNSAQNNDVISFLDARQERQLSAKQHIKQVLDEYNVNAVDTLIGDITPPEELMATLTTRKIAAENQVTYKTQMETEKTRQDLEKEKALANKQAEIIAADRGVQIAELQANAAIKKSEGEAKAVENMAAANAKKTELEAGANAKKVQLEGAAEASKIKAVGDAEASRTEAIGKANAEAYKLQVEAMGEDNFASLKVIESIATQKVKLVPDVLIAGEGGGVNGLLGLSMVNTLIGKNIIKPEIANAGLNIQGKANG